MGDFSFALSVAACFLSLLAAFSAVRTAVALRELQDRWPHLSESRLDSLETSLAEQADALQAVANRVKMQRVRNAANHVGTTTAEPDPYKDPDAWRQAMNKRIAAQRIPNG